MLIFGNDRHARGCFVEISRLGGPSNIGAVFSAVASASSGTSPYFISGAQIKQAEKYNIVQCFGDRNYTYAFGHDPTGSILEITFTAFLVDPSGNSFGQSLKTLMGAYASKRLSKTPTLATFSIGACSVQGFWVGMGSGTTDPEHNLQNFTAQLLIISAQSGSGSSSSGSSGTSVISASPGGATFPGASGTSYTPAPVGPSLSGTSPITSIAGVSPITSIAGVSPITSIAGTTSPSHLFI